jgi:uncharacterized membrane protein YtjA (UPF0391 family)
MPGLAITFLVIALIAGIQGFAGIAGAAVGIAKLIFLIFSVLFIRGSSVDFILSRGQYPIIEEFPSIREQRDHENKTTSISGPNQRIDRFSGGSFKPARQRTNLRWSERAG